MRYNLLGQTGLYVNNCVYALLPLGQGGLGKYGNIAIDEVTHLVRN
jgi:hypothetical protein